MFFLLFIFGERMLGQRVSCVVPPVLHSRPSNALSFVVDRSNDDQASPPAMGKLTPDLLMGNHYEADISDQSDGCLGVPQG